MAYTVDGKSLFERELKPVAASHTVAGPVVEVLVGDDTYGCGQGFG